MIMTDTPSHRHEDPEPGSKRHLRLRQKRTSNKKMHQTAACAPGCFSECLPAALQAPPAAAHPTTPLPVAAAACSSPSAAAGSFPAAAPRSFPAAAQGGFLGAPAGSFPAAGARAAAAAAAAAAVVVEAVVTAAAVAAAAARRRRTGLAGAQRAPCFRHRGRCFWRKRQQRCRTPRVGARVALCQHARGSRGRVAETRLKRCA